MTTPDGSAPARSTYTARRAPRLGVFLALGVLVGAVAAAVVTLIVHSGPTRPADPFTGVPLEFGSTLGIGVIAFGVLGALLASLVWLVMDRRSRSSASTYVLETTDDPAAADVALHRRELSAFRDRWGSSAIDDGPAGPETDAPAGTATGKDTVQ